MSSTKSPKRRAKSQQKKTGPTVSDLILSAVSASSQRGGTSLAPVKKALAAGGYDMGKNNARVLLAIRHLVANKALIQIKGTGASGSFKVNKKAPGPLKKAAVREKKPKAKRLVSVMKAAGGDAPAAKTSPKKKRKGPKKAKKPAAAKRPKSPRKVKKRVVRSTRTRAAAKK